MILFVVVVRKDVFKFIRLTVVALQKAEIQKSFHNKCLLTTMRADDKV